MEEDPPPQPEYEHPTRDVMIILFVFFDFGQALFSLLLGWLLGHPPLETFRWDPNAVVWGILATLPMVSMFAGMLWWPVGPLARVKDYCDNEVVPFLKGSAWTDLALVSLSQGVGEEMLFRGVLQPSITGWLQSSTGAWWGVPCGVGLAGILFGVCHPISLPYAVGAAILGLYLGTVWILTDNLLTVMVTHALFVFGALCYLLYVRRWVGPDSVSP